MEYGGDYKSPGEVGSGKGRGTYSECPPWARTQCNSISSEGDQQGKEGLSVMGARIWIPRILLPDQS